MLCVLWRFERLSSIRRYPICVLLINLMLAVQSINYVCTDFLESVFGANGRWNPTVCGCCGHGFLTQPELASQSASTLEKLLGNRFCHYRKTRTEKNGKTARNATEFLISVDLGKVWPPLIGTTFCLASTWSKSSAIAKKV